MDVNTSDKSIVLFDGVCNVCVWSIQFIIARDYKDRFRFASFQSAEGQKLITKHSLDVGSIILIQNNTIKKKSTAVISVESAGYPCETDLSILGMTGTIGDICECSCDDDLSLLDLNYNSVELIAVKDLLGNSIKTPIFNKPIFFIYSDGSVKKRVFNR